MHCSSSINNSLVHSRRSAKDSFRWKTSANCADRHQVHAVSNRVYELHRGATHADHCARIQCLKSRGPCQRSDTETGCSGSSGIRSTSVPADLRSSRTRSTNGRRTISAPNHGSSQSTQPTAEDIFRLCGHDPVCLHTPRHPHRPRSAWAAPAAHFYHGQSGREAC